MGFLPLERESGHKILLISTSRGHVHTMQPTILLDPVWGPSGWMLRKSNNKSINRCKLHLGVLICLNGFINLVFLVSLAGSAAKLHFFLTSALHIFATDYSSYSLLLLLYPSSSTNLKLYLCLNVGFTVSFSLQMGSNPQRPSQNW